MPNWPATLSCFLYNASPRKIFVDDLNIQSSNHTGSYAPMIITLPDLSTVKLGTTFEIAFSTVGNYYTVQIVTYSLNNTVISMDGNAAGNPASKTWITAIHFYDTSLLTDGPGWAFWWFGTGTCGQGIIRDY